MLRISRTSGGRATSRLSCDKADADPVRFWTGFIEAAEAVTPGSAPMPPTCSPWVISVVDPQARHGHKTSARGFDGYKGHVAADPDSEIITATGATPGNSGDAEAAESLLGEMLPGDQDSAAAQDGGPPTPRRGRGPAGGLR
jgi:hypothetical protein